MPLWSGSGSARAEDQQLHAGTDLRRSGAARLRRFSFCDLVARPVGSGGRSHRVILLVMLSLVFTNKSDASAGAASCPVDKEQYRSGCSRTML